MIIQLGVRHISILDAEQPDDHSNKENTMSEKEKTKEYKDHIIMAADCDNSYHRVDVEEIIGREGGHLATIYVFTARSVLSAEAIIDKLID